MMTLATTWVAGIVAALWFHHQHIRLRDAKFSPVSITDAAGSPVRVLARADDEPLDHGTTVYSAKAGAAPKYPARDFGR